MEHLKIAPGYISQHKREQRNKEDQKPETNSRMKINYGCLSLLSGLISTVKCQLASVNWTWISGNPDTQQLGFYGTLMKEDKANIPGYRIFHAMVVDDKSGSVFLFGGKITDSGKWLLIC